MAWSKQECAQSVVHRPTAVALGANDQKYAFSDPAHNQDDLCASLCWKNTASHLATRCRVIPPRKLRVPMILQCRGWEGCGGVLRAPLRSPVCLVTKAQVFITLIFNFTEYKVTSSLCVGKIICSCFLQVLSELPVAYRKASQCFV